MKKWVIVAAVVGLLTGCSSTPEPAATPTPTEDPSTFIEDMKSTGEYVGLPDSYLEDIATSVCDALKDGSTPDDAKYYLGVGGLDDADAETVLLASIKEFCPEFS